MKHILMTTAALTLVASVATAQEQCSVAWSHYVGWELAGYIQDSGVAARVGEKHGVDLEFVFLNDYVATLEQFAAGTYAGVTATTIDALSIPAAAGVDVTVLVVGDYSNGNDAVLVKDPTGSIRSLADLVGTDINLYEYTISDYLFERWMALDGDGLTIRDFNIVNTTDADIANVFAAGPEGTVVVTWNPMVMEAMATVEGTQILFDSSKIPGEILDAVVVSTDTGDACKAAITEAWYTGTTIMSGEGNKADAAIAAMADFASGGAMGDDSVAWFATQLATTEMFYQPADGAAVARSAELQQSMSFVYDFVMERGLLSDPVGVLFPDGSTVGDPDNILLRFDASYMEAMIAQ